MDEHDFAVKHSGSREGPPSPPSHRALLGYSHSQLSAMLKERGLPCTGSKSSKVNRLLTNWYTTKPSKTEEKRVTPSTHRRYCCVPDCHSYSKKMLADGTTVSLHRIPTDSERKRQWIQRLDNVRKNLVVNDSTRVCCLHFVDRDAQGVPTVFPTKPHKEPTARRKLERVALQDVEDSDELDLGCAVLPSEQPPKTLETLPRTRDIGVQVGPPMTQTWTDFGCQTTLPDVGLSDIRSDEKARFYTGFVNLAMMMHFFRVLKKHGAEKLNYWDGQKRSLGDKSYHQEGISKPGRKRSMPLEEEFLMTMMRLRLGILENHLADIFKVSVSTVSRILSTWINFIYDHAKGLIPWPSKQQILWNLPQSFADFPNTQIVLDCTEFFVQKPTSLLAQNLTWSEYKHNNTIKVLIGVTPSGLVSFVSRVWGGRCSDRHITKESNLLPRIDPEMTIMADKGFTILDLLPPDVNLNIPPRIPGHRQMSAWEFFNTTQIARSRIVVEMKMEQIKNYQILNRTIPISEMPLAEQYILICSALTNFLPPLLK